jgi:hypothetical protein
VTRFAGDYDETVAAAARWGGRPPGSGTRAGHGLARL